VLLSSGLLPRNHRSFVLLSELVILVLPVNSAPYDGPPRMSIATFAGSEAGMDTREPTDALLPVAGPVGLRGLRHVVLLGLMGSGKTAVGRQLARELAVRFQDNDGRLAEASGLTPRELRLREGEAALHALEAHELLAALREPRASVISAAASVVESEACRAAMRDPGICAIWLRARAATIVTRFHNEPHRPVYSDDLEAFFERQLAERAPLYLEVADSAVDVDDLSLDDVVERALTIVHAHEAARVTTAGRDGSAP
jgi:shikimate kinase